MFLGTPSATRDPKERQRLSEPPAICFVWGDKSRQLLRVGPSRPTGSGASTSRRRRRPCAIAAQTRRGLAHGVFRGLSFTYFRILASLEAA